MIFFKLAVLMTPFLICNAKRVNEMEVISDQILELNGVLEDLKIKVAIQQAELEEIENRRIKIEIGKNQPKKLRRMKRDDEVWKCSKQDFVNYVKEENCPCVTW